MHCILCFQHNSRIHSAQHTTSIAMDRVIAPDCASHASTTMLPLSHPVLLRTSVYLPAAFNTTHSHTFDTVSQTTQMASTIDVSMALIEEDTTIFMPPLVMVTCCSAGKPYQSETLCCSEGCVWQLMVWQCRRSGAAPIASWVQQLACQLVSCRK